MSHSILVSAIANGDVVTIIYVKANGIMNVRAIKPYAIERCKNGSAIVRALCVHQNDAPRSFTLADVLSVAQGNEVGERVGFLRDSLND